MNKVILTGILFILLSFIIYINKGYPIRSSTTGIALELKYVLHLYWSNITAINCASLKWIEL